MVQIEGLGRVYQTKIFQHNGRVRICADNGITVTMVPNRKDDMGRPETWVYVLDKGRRRWSVLQEPGAKLLPYQSPHDVVIRVNR